MKTVDPSEGLKDLYKATKKVRELAADSGTFFAVDGQGELGGEAFQQAIQALFSTAYTVKFTLKKQGLPDFKVGMLECLFLSDPGKTPMSQWQWRMLVRVGNEVTAKNLTDAKKMIREKKGFDAAAAKRIRWKEGSVVQVLHVGPYDQVGPTYQQLHAYAQEHGLEIKGPAHEIYLSNPCRVAPDKLKTIVRLAVKKAP
jgi:hypothetical protein